MNLTASKKELKDALRLLRQHVSEEDKYLFEDAEIHTCKKCNRSWAIESVNDSGLCPDCEKIRIKSRNKILTDITGLLTKKIEKIIEFKRTVDEDNNEVILSYKPGGLGRKNEILGEKIEVIITLTLEEQDIMIKIGSTKLGSGPKRNAKFCIADPNVDVSANEWITKNLYKIELLLRSRLFVPKNMAFKKYVELGGNDHNFINLAKVVGEA